MNALHVSLMAELLPTGHPAGAPLNADRVMFQQQAKWEVWPKVYRARHYKLPCYSYKIYVNLQANTDRQWPCQIGCAVLNSSTIGRVAEMK